MGINKNALVWRGKLFSLIEEKQFSFLSFGYKGKKLHLYGVGCDGKSFPMTPKGIKQAYKWLQEQPSQ